MRMKLLDDREGDVSEMLNDETERYIVRQADLVSRGLEGAFRYKGAQARDKGAAQTEASAARRKPKAYWLRVGLKRGFEN